MPRFDNLPERLREQAEIVSTGSVIDLSEALTISATMEDAALKIEALGREMGEVEEDDLESVEELVTYAESTNDRYLETVILGTKVVFEPAEVVTRYKQKKT